MKCRVSGLIILCVAFVLCIIFEMRMYAMSNPWTDCFTNFKCATEVSGIHFNPNLSNYNVRAMKGMIEINYLIGLNRNVALRKSEEYIGDDISGVYTKYPVNKILKLENGVNIKVRGTISKIYVMNFSAESGYYSAYCEQGLSKKEVEDIYNIIREAEESKSVSGELSKYSFCELGDLVGKDVKRVKYHNYTLDYHKKEYSKSQIKKFAESCILEGVGNQREMDCCMTYKMFPQG